MRILLDTNVIIYREDHRVVPENLQRLIQLLSEEKSIVLIHPASKDELVRDEDDKRRVIIQSKLKSYPILESPPDPRLDKAYLGQVGVRDAHQVPVDMILLYCIYRNAVDFLLTEDIGIHRIAMKLGLDDRILLIDEALEFFETQVHRTRTIAPPSLKKVPMHNLDLKDPFFTSFRKPYPYFDEWFIDKAKEGRMAWVNRSIDGKIGALLILKTEEEAIESTPPIAKKKRLKISTFKVINYGQKIGELLIRIAFEEASSQKVDEIYLTHFIEPDDRLVPLLEEYGFREAARYDNGEAIYLKRLRPPSRGLEHFDPSEFNKEFFPCFYDGRYVSKFIIPIQPRYHEMLFTDVDNRQTRLPEHEGGFIVEGNTIKKAYISNSRIKGMKKSDVVLFYRSDDWQSITSVGTIEVVKMNIRDVDKILQIVGKRTVYSRSELKEITKKPTTVILFRHHTHLPRKVSLAELTRANVLAGHPQSIVRIPDEKYSAIKRMCGIDESLTFN